MRVGAPHEGCIEHPRKLDVFDIQTSSGDKSLVFLAWDRLSQHRCSPPHTQIYNYAAIKYFRMKSAIPGRTICARSWQQCTLSSQIIVSSGTLPLRSLIRLVALLSGVMMSSPPCTTSVGHVIFGA